MHRYEGLIAAPHAPFAADGQLNLNAIDLQAQVLAESQVRGAFVCGSTGESHSLTVDERKRIAARWVEAAARRYDVIVHVGHNCQRDAMAMASHAQQIGAAAIAAMAPCYFKPASVDDLIDFLAAIAAAAPKLPFYYYDIPSMSGVSLPTDQFLVRGGGRIPTLAGIKYTSCDLMTVQACLAADNGRFEVLYGGDEMLLAALALGVRGAVGSTYNYAAPVYHRVLRAFRDHDLATAQLEQRKSVALVQVLSRFGVLRAGKAIMGMLGADCGPVRSPIRPMTPAESLDLYEQLKSMDIFIRPLCRPGSGE